MKIVKIKPFPNSYWSDQSQFRDQQSLTGKKLEHRVIRKEKKAGLKSLLFCQQTNIRDITLRWALKVMRG